MSRRSPSRFPLGLAAALLLLVASSTPASARWSSTPAAPSAVEAPHTLRLPYAANAFEYTGPFDATLYEIATYGRSLLAGPNCDWEAGTWAYGLGEAWRETGDSRYLDLLREWTDNCLALRLPVHHVNDSLLGLAAVTVFEAGGGESRRAYADAVRAFLETAPRSTGGALFHETDTVWDDTLLGVVPFLLAYDRIDGERQDAAIFARDQVLLHGQRLQDPVTGLYRHAWDESRNEYIGPHFWGRGNGWVLLTQVEALRATPASDPSFNALLAQFRRHQQAVLALQKPGGLWPTILTRSDFYDEMSGSALIGYALRRSIVSGLEQGLPTQVALYSAQKGGLRNIGSGGRVMDVSAPTGPMQTQAEYAAIPCDRPQLYGQGAALLFFMPLREGKDGQR